MTQISPPTLVAKASCKMRLPSVVAQVQQRAAAAALASFLLLAPLSPDAINGGASPLLPPLGVQPVSAKELASGSGSKVNKDPLSLLRLGLPNQPKEVRAVQAKLEETEDSLSRLLVNNAKSASKDATTALKGGKAKIAKVTPGGTESKMDELLESLVTQVAELNDNLAANQVGNAQAKVKSALLTVTNIEELIASGYTQPVPPSEFTASVPWLKGRASIDFEMKRPGGKFDVDGELYETLKMSVIVDGYTAPVTAGNFVDLVSKGFYDGYHIQRSDGFVVQTGDPTAEGKGDKNGYVQDGKIRNVPLEVFVKGDKEPIYGMTFDDDSRGGYAATLPFNAYGALGMAREEYNVDSASSQWFWLLFDSDLTPAGKNLLDGRYACFGYTVDGARLLSDVKEGDIIASAKVSSGESNLVLPTAPALAVTTE